MGRGAFVHPIDDVKSEGSPPEPSSSLPLTILIPVFNDWAVADALVAKLDAVFSACGRTASVVFVDDGSTEPLPANFPGAPPRSLEDIRILELRKNLGHQRALAVGLVHLHLKSVEGAVLLMDGDGEDEPSEIPRLLEEFARQGQRKIIFAARARRAEGIVFKFFYQIYRTVHRLLVGFDIRIGNFSVVPAAFLERLAVTSDLWNHYAASVIKMRLPHASIPINRAKRIAGESKMNFAGLVIHGLSAMSVFGDTVGVRLLTASGIFAAATVALMIAAVIVKFATNLAIPGWATNVTGLLLVLLCQSLLLSLIFTFGVLYSRGQSSFIPVRDCPLFVSRERTVFRRHD